MKLPKAVKSLLKNKIVLYAVSIIAFLNLFAYIMSGCVETVIFFALTGVITSCFTKNMIIVLGTSILLTNTFAVCKSAVQKNMPVGSLLEGMDNKEGASGNKDDGKKEEEKEKEEEKKEDDKKAEKPNEESKKEEMTTVYKKNNRVDYAATVEEAYDDLNKILGSDGVKNISKDTEKLVEQQQQLTKMMQDMGPMVDKVSGIIGKVGGKDGLDKMMQSIKGVSGAMPSQ
jgi:uncharacterized membrane protein YcgQ (UPF0703/DUF1980 family)